MNLATQLEAETGADNTKIMTPLRVAQAIDAQVVSASQAEAETGTENTKFLTSLRGRQGDEAFLKTETREPATPPDFFLDGLFTQNFASTYAGGPKTLTATANGVLVVDSVTMLGDEIIGVGRQTTQTENGVYVVTDPGTAGTPAILTRHDRFDESEEVRRGTRMQVRGGAKFGGSVWVVEYTPPFTLDATNLTFSRVGRARPLEVIAHSSSVTLDPSEIDNTVIRADMSGGAFQLDLPTGDEDLDGYTFAVVPFGGSALLTLAANGPDTLAPFGDTVFELVEGEMAIITYDFTNTQWVPISWEPRFRWHTYSGATEISKREAYHRGVEWDSGLLATDFTLPVGDDSLAGSPFYIVRSAGVGGGNLVAQGADVFFPTGGASLALTLNTIYGFIYDNIGQRWMRISTQA